MSCEVSGHTTKVLCWEGTYTQIWFWIRYIAKVILISRRYKFNKYLRQQTRKFKGRGWLKNNGNYFENYSWPLYTLINKVIGASKTPSRNKVSCYREAVIFQEFIYLACMTVSAPIQICIIFKPIGIQANFVQLYYHSTTYNETICSLLIFSTQCGILMFFPATQILSEINGHDFMTIYGLLKS